MLTRNQIKTQCNAARVTEMWQPSLNFYTTDIYSINLFYKKTKGVKHC